MHARHVHTIMMIGQYYVYIHSHRLHMRDVYDMTTMVGQDYVYIYARFTHVSME